MKEKAEGVLKKWDQYKYVALVVLIGITLLVWPDSKNTPAPVQDSPLPAVNNVESELEQVLGSMNGVGQVKVMLAMESDGERQLAQDIETQYSGNELTPEKFQRTSEIVLKNGTGGDEPMIVRTMYPTYRGALIVCQGGDQPEVRLAVTEAVAALTGLSSDRISVAKWQ